MDVASDTGPAELKWSKKAPDWRKAKRGMCSEGKCTNIRCKAYRKMVIMNNGFAEFDFINDAYTCKCPICDEGIIPSTCGFNNSQWMVIGRKIDKLGQRPTMFRKSVGDVYARFSPEVNGTAHFLDLKILCKEVQRSAKSNLCCVHQTYK